MTNNIVDNIVKKERKNKKEKENKIIKPYNNYKQACNIFKESSLYHFNTLY
jgi:hypothetical protein